MDKLKWGAGNCQSLVGYADEVHRNSGGACEYCEYGSGELDFDLWRQLSLEHVIPSSWLDWKRLQRLLEELFAPYPINLFERKKRGSTELPEGRQLRHEIEMACCATACQFCNSMTSWFERKHGGGYRSRFHAIFQSASIREADGFKRRREAILKEVKKLRDEILDIKKRDVAERIQALKEHFEEHIRSGLEQHRR